MNFQSENTNKFVINMRDQIMRDIQQFGLNDVKESYGLSQTNLKHQELIDKMISIEMENCFG